MIVAIRQAESGETPCSFKQCHEPAKVIVETDEYIYGLCPEHANTVANKMIYLARKVTVYVNQ